MNGLTLFGFVAVSLMLTFYALEKRSAWFILAFSGSCVLASAVRVSCREPGPSVSSKGSGPL